MNENAKKWVEALRSGDYEQGKRRLAVKNDGETKFCCLGVACELAIEAGLPITRVDLERSGATVIGYQQDTEASLPYIEKINLPHLVRDWLGLASDAGSFVNPSGGLEYLTGLNDRGKAFSAIAAIIESEPKGLFDD